MVRKLCLYNPSPGHETSNPLIPRRSKVAASLGLFMIHNNIRRNLLTCSQHAKSVTAPKYDPFRYYADYTIYVLEDQLESVDTIWFPIFAKYDSRFIDQINAHAPIKEKIGQLKELLKPTEESFPCGQIAAEFQTLHELVNSEFDKEEQLSNDLGRVVPLEEIKKLDAQQEARRKADEKIWGLPWTFAFLMKGLSPKERAIFPPGMPRLIKDAMLGTGTLRHSRLVIFSLLCPTDRPSHFCPLNSNSRLQFAPDFRSTK